MIKEDPDAAPERKSKGVTSTKSSDSTVKKGSGPSPRSPPRSKSRASPGSAPSDANERKVKQPSSDGGAADLASPRRSGVPPSIDTSAGNNAPSSSNNKGPIMRQGSSEMSERSYLQAQTPKHSNKRASSISGGKKNHGPMPQHPPAGGARYPPHHPHQGQGPPPHYEGGYQGGPPPGGPPHHPHRPDNRYPRHPNDNGPPPPEGYYRGPPNSEQRPYPGPNGPPPSQGRYGGPPPYYNRDDNNGPPPPHGPPPNKDGPPQSPRRGPPPPYGVGGPGGAFTPTDRKGGFQHPYYQQAGQQSSGITVVSPGNGPQPPPGEYRGGPPPQQQQQPPFSPHRGGGNFYQDGRGPREGDHPYNRPPPHEGNYRGGYGGDRGYNQGPPPHDGYRRDDDRYGGQDNRGGYRDYPQLPPPSYNNGPQGPPHGEEQGYRGPPPHHDSRYPPRDGHPPSDRPPYPPNSDYHGGGWNRPPPRPQSEDPNTYHRAGPPSQRPRGPGEHEAAGFTRAVSSSFGDSEKSRPHRDPDDDAASDSSWRQLKQVASVDEEQMQARIQRQEGGSADKRKSKGGVKDREMATTTPTPQDGVADLPHPNSNASSLSTSPSDSRNHAEVDVRGAPDEVQYPQLPTPSKLMSLNSLSSVASIQEPMGTGEDTNSLSGNVNMDLMQCNTGSGSLLFSSKNDNLDEDNPGANGSVDGSRSESGSDKKRARESRGDGETSNDHKDGSDEIRRAPSDIKDPQTKSKESGHRPSKRSRKSRGGKEEEEKLTSSPKSSDKKRKSKERPSTPPVKYKASPLSIPSSPPFTPGGILTIPSKGEEGGRGHLPSKSAQGHHGHPHHLPPHGSNKSDRRGPPHRTGSFGSPTYYDKAPAYSYSIESLPSFPKDVGESGYERFRPGSSASGPINAVRVEGSEGGPPRSQDYKDTVSSALSWDIQGQDSFGGAMTVASNGSVSGGGAHGLLSSFSFGNDYQMLMKSGSNVGGAGPNDRNPNDRGMDGPPQSQQGGPSPHHPQRGGPPPHQGPPHHGGRSGPPMTESRNQSFDQSRAQSFESGQYPGSQRSRPESYDSYGGPPPHYQGNGPDGYKSSGQRNGPPPPHPSQQSPPPSSQSFPPHASSWGTSASHHSSYSSNSGNRHPGPPQQSFSGDSRGGPGSSGPPGRDGYNQYRGSGRPHSPPPHGGPQGGPPSHHQGGPPPPHHRGQYPNGPDSMMRSYSGDGSRMGASSPPPLHQRGGHGSWGGPPPPHERHHPGWGPGPDHHRGEPHNLPNAFQPPPPEFSNVPQHVGGKRPPPTVYIVSSNPAMRGPPGGDPSLMSKTGIGSSGVYGWSKDDDAWLTEIMKKYKNPRDWEPIAKQHGRGKTAKECHERWIRYLKPGVRKGQWQDHEDAIVVEAVSTSTEQPFTRWSDLAQRLPGRVGKQIRDRWVNHLNPAINHMPFSREDDLLLWDGHKKLGKRWVEISTKFFNSTRSENHIKNRWYSASFKKFIANEFGPDAYAGKGGNAEKKNKDKKEKSSGDSDLKKVAVKREEGSTPPPVAATEASV